MELADTAVFKTEALAGNAGSNPAGTTVTYSGEFPMTTKVQAMKHAEALRDRLKAQISELQQQLAGVEMTIRAMRGEPATPVRSRAPRSNVKGYILALLEDAQARGLNAAMAVEIAEARGETLERGTVSSLLSRFKADGVVTYDGSVYRLPRYTQNSTASATDHAAVH